MQQSVPAFACQEHGAICIPLSILSIYLPVLAIAELWSNHLESICTKPLPADGLHLETRWGFPFRVFRFRRDMDSLSAIGVASQLPIAIEIQLLYPDLWRAVLRQSVLASGQVIDTYMQPAEGIRPFTSQVSEYDLCFSLFHLLKFRRIPFSCTFPPCTLLPD